jgi:hypothetical protein
MSTQEFMKNNTQEFIKNELWLRRKLYNTPEFIKESIKIAKALGVTAEQWNENKELILMHIANEIIGLDNVNGKKIRNSIESQN